MARKKKLKGDQWWNSDNDQISDRVFSIVRSLEDDQLLLKDENRLYSSLYSNRGMIGMDFDDYTDFDITWDDDAVSFNVIRSCCDTITAKIAKSRPTIKFLPLS